MGAGIPSVRTLLDFTGRVVLVTGSGGWLGAGIARRFAEAGARVAVHYRSSQASAEATVGAVQAHGGRAVALRADLANPAEVAGLVGAVVAALGRLDVLINNAGDNFPLVSVLDMTPMQWDAMLADNLRSVFLCTQAAARQMIAQGPGGAIVNITSIESENPAPLHSHYDASKAGVLMYTRASANELAPHGIRVNAVAPGLIWREGLDQAWPEGVAGWQRAAPLQRLGRPDDVADACLFLASPGARWITGASLTVDGGVLTHRVY